MLLIVELIPVGTILDLFGYANLKSFMDNTALAIRATYIPGNLIGITFLHNDLTPGNKNIKDQEPCVR